MAMSGQYISLFIMILLMQACLVDAKRLRIAKHSIVSQLNRDMHTAIIDSCVPLYHQHQLKDCTAAVQQITSMEI